MLKYLLIFTLFLIVFSEDCQSDQYFDNGTCHDCPEECTECNSSSICLACKEEYTLNNSQLILSQIDIVQSECIKDEETPNSTVIITDCMKYESNVCIGCKYGTPFVDYEYELKNLSGMCQCPDDNYKIKISENEYECQTLNQSIIFNENAMISQTLEELAQNAQIIYALQKISSNQNENELILLKVLEYKIAELTQTGIKSESLELLLDVLEIINCSNTEEETLIIEHLRMICDSENFTTSEEYQDLFSLISEFQQQMSSENQNKIEIEVLILLQQKFLQFKKDNLATEIVSLTLSTGQFYQNIIRQQGQIELSKIEDEKTFNNVKLIYPSAVIEALKENNDSISIIVSVQQTSKDQFKKDGIDAKLLLDPITIMNYQMGNGDSFQICSEYSGDAVVLICFDGMNQLQNAVCMYWNNSKLSWSTEGVSLNQESLFLQQIIYIQAYCCESTHFSTFGVIENGDCQIGQYFNDEACHDCPEECTQCNSPSICLACKEEYTLNNFECIKDEDCQIGQYFDDGTCHDCPEECTECNSSSICLACKEEYTLNNSQLILSQIDIVQSECIKDEETPNSTVIITDCMKYESNVCIGCKYGTPFVDYEYELKNLSGMCQCPDDNYKIKISENEYECQTLNQSIIFNENAMISQTLEELAQNAQIIYALQKISSNQNENELILLKVLEYKIAELTQTGIKSESLELLLDVLEIINCSNTEEETLIIEHLRMICDSENFTTSEEYQDLFSLISEFQQQMSSENQNKIEIEVLILLQQKFLQFKKDNLATEIVSLTLSTGQFYQNIIRQQGQIELSKIEDEKTFNNVKLIYPSAVIEALKENNDSISIIVSVQQTSKDQFKKDGIDAKLLLDPITIMNYQMGNGDSFQICSEYSGDAVVQICFDGMNQLENTVCMYWDNSTLSWSTEGVSLNQESLFFQQIIFIQAHCCESTHFSTFGVIENGEQTVEVDATNPGEYGDKQLCDGLTVNCLECNADTGKCLKCAGYLDSIDGSCCGDGEKRIYSDGIWSCKEENYESGVSFILNTDNCNEETVDIDKMMQIAYESTDFLKLCNIALQIDQCSTFFNTSDSILTELKILNGIMKDSSSIDSTTMYDIINISSTIWSNENSNTIEIIKYFLEFQGQTIKKINNNKEKYADLNISSLFDNIIQCFEKLLSLNPPINSIPTIYHFSTFYIRIGKIIPNQTLTSLLYQDKYGIQLTSDLLLPLDDGNSYYYIHVVEENIPYWDLVEIEEKLYAQYFRIYDKDFNGIEQIELKHCDDSAPIKFKSPGSDVILVLKSLVNENWEPKVVCYDENDTYAICYPASYDSQFLFMIDKIDEIPLPAQEDCLIEDIPGCRICNSEKECQTCYDGQVLDGEFYGRCECPEGYYKNGFNSTDCETTENLQETWNQQVSQFGTIGTLKESFIDLAYMVNTLNNNTAYEEYMDKLISLMDNEISMKQLNLVLDVVGLFSSAIKENIEEDYYKIFEIIYNITSNKTIDSNLDYKTLVSTGNVTIGSTTLEITSILWDRIKAAKCDTYKIIMHEMKENQNPYDLIQVAKMYSNIVNFELICVTGQTVTAYDQLTLSGYYTISFAKLGSNETSPQCVYWDGNSWDTNGSRESSYSNKCEWKHFSTFAIIKENSSSTICDSRCKTCESYSVCLTCESNKYLIDKMCYTSIQLTLDLVLRENAIVYIRKVTEDTYIGYDTDNKFNYFELSNATTILYTQIQWRVNILESNTYTFTNIYQNTRLDYNSTQNFEIQNLDNLTQNLSSTYLNEGLMIPFNKTNCLTTDTDLNFILETCNQDTQQQWWEFIPKKSTDHDPIPLSAELSGTDTIEIKYNHNNTQDISEAVFILAEKYTDNLDILDSLTCSSSNENSYVNFEMKTNNVQVEVSLSDLLTCGFILDTDSDNNTVISGQIIVIFIDTEQIFYYPFTISLDSNATIVEADILKDASIKSIQVQQGSASTLNTQFVATVKLLNSASSSSTDSLEINGDFNLQLSLPSDVQSTYSINDPGTGKLIYFDGSYDVSLEISNTTQKNTYEVQVTIPDDIPDGSYRLKFSCILSLQANRFRRILQRLLSDSQAGLIVDKSFTITRTNSQNNETEDDNSTENQTIYDNTAVKEESEDNSLNLGIILLLIMSGVVALALIVGIIYYALRIQKNKKMRESIVAKKQMSTPENVEVDNLAESPNKI